MCYNLTIINNTGTMFWKRKEPIVFYTDDRGVNSQIFEERFMSKFGQECMVVIVQQGHHINKVSK